MSTFCLGTLTWASSYSYVKCVIRHPRIYIEKGHLSLSLSASLSQSYLIFTLSLFVCQILLEHLSHPLSPGLAVLPGPGLARSGEKNKTMQLCLLMCHIMCQIPLGVLWQTVHGDSFPHIWVLYPCVGPFEPLLGLALESFSCAAVTRASWWHCGLYLDWYVEWCYTWHDWEFANLPFFLMCKFHQDSETAL